MNNEEKILQLLSQLTTTVDQMQSDMTQVKTDVSNLIAGQERIEKKLDIVYEQTADLVEFKTETITKLDIIDKNVCKLSSDFTVVEAITGKNMQDIAHLKSIK